LRGAEGLGEAKALMSTGHYAASEKKTLRVLEAYPDTLGDEALFLMGLIYASSNNPTADYGKSKAFFEKLVAQYPESVRAEEAAVWSLILTRIVAEEKETSELQKKVKTLKQTAEARGKKLKQLQDELEGREKEIGEHWDSVIRLQGRVTELESQLAKFKSIDLTIEQKKRATAP
jgi:septal ring factor EnvC (AmiA/AmiB activator)